MSELMTSHEIEDVLSSIRRLVSEELRPVPRPAKPADGGDKLILTPALRVVETLTPVVDADTPMPDRDAAVAWPEPPAAVPDSAPPVTELPDGVADTQTLDEAIAYGAPDTDDAVEPHPSASDGPAMADDASATEAAPLGFEAMLEAMRATDQPAAREAEAAGFDPADGGVEDAEVIAETPHPAADPIWPSGEDGAVTGDEAPPEPEWAARVRATQARADQAEAEAVAEILQAGSGGPAPHPAAGPAEGPGMFDADDTLLDEEMLRDLVREIIREELQGTLGERITRNVRKLVRAEINRSLASRDFD